MGKVVRGIKIESQAFVVAVPEVERSPDRPAFGELDERFASPGGPLAFENDEDALFETAAPPPEPAPLVQQVDWVQVRADAHAIVEEAASASEAMLKEAAQRAAEIVQRAQTHAETIEAEAQARGHNAGVEAGKAKIEGELAGKVADLQAVVEEARAQRNKIVETAEPELVRLAMAIAERIVHEQIAIDPSVVVENVRQALTRLVGREVVTLRVNPVDLDTIRQHRDALASSSDVEHLRVVEDQRVDRGGVVVETDAGTIDAKISTQIREARRALVGEGSANGTAPEPIELSSAQAS